MMGLIVCFFERILDDFPNLVIIDDNNARDHMEGSRLRCPIFKRASVDFSQPVGAS